MNNTRERETGSRRGRLILFLGVALSVFLLLFYFALPPLKGTRFMQWESMSMDSQYYIKPMNFKDNGEWNMEELFPNQVDLDPVALAEKYCKHRLSDTRKAVFTPPKPIRFHPSTIEEAIRPSPLDPSRNLITRCTYIDPQTGFIMIKEDNKYYPNVDHKGLPLCFAIDPQYKIRVNLIYHELESVGRGLSAGPQGILNMAMAAHKAGFNARIIDLRDHHPRNAIPNHFKLDSQMNFDSFVGYFDKIEVWFGGDRKSPIPVSPYDVFIAGFWPTAFPAHHAARDLGRTHFLYLVSDYEPLFYPGGAKYALAYETYTLPHHLITNAPTMLKSLKARNDSVFSGRFDSDPEEMSIALKHPIPSIPLYPDKIRERILHSNKRRVLIYARVMERNAFDLIVHAMRIVYESGGFDGKDWEFHGIGHHTQPNTNVGFPLKHIGSFKHDEYAEKLSDYDLGISLIVTPNINFAQLDFAAAGMVTVVNTFESKKQEDYDAIGGNFIATEPTSHHLAAGILEAIKRVEDVEARIKGANLNWPHKFDAAWNDENVEKYKRMIEDIMYCRWIDEKNDVDHFYKLQ